jgi:tRNA threonylcarbamoyladenosine biosynthesis protein TsaB
MLFLSIRTDKPDAEVGLFEDKNQIAYEVWGAHRELSVQLHHKIEDLLATKGKALADINGVVCFAGPGSFTGLRIGLTVGDVLAYGLDKPVVGSKDPDWIQKGIDRLMQGETDKVAMPDYGAPVHITTPKH